MAEYIYKEKSYQVVSSGKMKQANGKWLPAVIYSNGREMFVREQADFYKKFHLKG